MSDPFMVKEAAIQMPRLRGEIRNNWYLRNKPGQRGYMARVSIRGMMKSLRNWITAYEANQ